VESQVGWKGAAEERNGDGWVMLTTKRGIVIAASEPDVEESETLLRIIFLDDEGGGHRRTGRVTISDLPP